MTFHNELAIEWFESAGKGLNFPRQPAVHAGAFAQRGHVHDAECLAAQTRIALADALDSAPIGGIRGRVKQIVHARQPQGKHAVLRIAERTGICRDGTGTGRNDPVVIRMHMQLTRFLARSAGIRIKALVSEFLDSAQRMPNLDDLRLSIQLRNGDGRDIAVDDADARFRHFAAHLQHRACEAGLVDGLGVADADIYGDTGHARFQLFGEHAEVKRFLAALTREQRDFVLLRDMGIHRMEQIHACFDDVQIHATPPSDQPAIPYGERC